MTPSTPAGTCLLFGYWRNFPQSLLWEPRSQAPEDKKPHIKGLEQMSVLLVELRLLGPHIHLAEAGLTPVTVLLKLQPQKQCSPLLGDLPLGQHCQLVDARLASPA